MRRWFKCRAVRARPPLLVRRVHPRRDRPMPGPALQPQPRSSLGGNPATPNRIRCMRASRFIRPPSRFRRRQRRTPGTPPPELALPRTGLMPRRMRLRGLVGLVRRGVARQPREPKNVSRDAPSRPPHSAAGPTPPTPTLRRGLRPAQRLDWHTPTIRRSASVPMDPRGTGGRLTVNGGQRPSGSRRSTKSRLRSSAR